MAKHHIVQGKYLAQWRKSGTENQLNIYVIEENQIIERGPGWKGFWREDYNVLEDEGEKSYLPEDVTAIIDSKGIENTYSERRIFIGYRCSKLHSFLCGLAVHKNSET